MLSTVCSIAPSAIATAAPIARVVAPYAHTLWDAARAEGLSDALLAGALGRAALGDEDVPVAEVGFLLGFQDTPAFHHASKSWQGAGPGQYRTSSSSRDNVRIGGGSTSLNHP